LKEREREEGEEFGVVLCLIRSFARFLVLSLFANMSASIFAEYLRRY